MLAQNTIMPDLDSDEWNQLKPIGMVAKVASIATQLLVNAYSYADVARLIKVNDPCEEEDEDDEEEDEGEEDDGEDTDEEDNIIEPKSDDPLATVLVHSLYRLESSTREFDIKPAHSVAQLFQPGKDAKSLKPRLWLAFDLAHDEAQAVGVCTGCRFVRSETMLTDRFTNQYITQHKLPRDLQTHFFIDIISSDHKPAGVMMLLNVFVYASKNKFSGVAMVAVTKAGVKSGVNFGFQKTHTYREDGAQRTLMTLGINDLSLAHLNKKLKIGNANNKILQDLCSRNGLQERTKNKIYPRC